MLLTKRILLASAAATLVAVASPALAQKKYDQGASDTEIKIGNTNPYSGPASAYGTIGKTIEAYFKKVNAEGGINGRKVTFISYDDGYSPPKAVEQVRKLVESDEVLLVFQPLGTPSNTAIQKYMNSQEGAAAVRCDRRHQVGRPEELPLDHGLAADLPGGRADLRQVRHEEPSECQDRDPVPERRLRQRLREGSQGRPRRQGKDHDRV